MTTHQERRPILKPAAALAASLVLFGSACKKTVDDATLTSNVHNALAADNAISQQPVQETVQQGVVTLTGNVSDDTASSVAAEDAARVAGVKEVVNDLTVSGIQVAPTVVSPAAPKVARSATPAERTALANHAPLPPPPPENTAPPAPSFRDVIVPAGTGIPVRITQTLDSQTAQTGQSFSGIVTHEVIADGMVVIPAGSGVSGQVIDAKDAGRFKGHSELSLQVTSINRHRQSVAVSTEPYTVEGKNRGTNSAEKIGGGAAVGAILGGIFGGGKGAAIGAAAGGGGGAVLQGATHGQQVSIPSESVIRFRLASSFTVRTAETPSGYDPVTDPELRTR